MSKREQIGTTPDGGRIMREANGVEWVDHSTPAEAEAEERSYAMAQWFLPGVVDRMAELYVRERFGDGKVAQEMAITELLGYIDEHTGRDYETAVAMLMHACQYWALRVADGRANVPDTLERLTA